MSKHMPVNQLNFRVVMYLTESGILFSVNVVFALKSFSITNSAVFFYPQLFH